MNIQTMKLKDLKPYKNNPRNNDAAVDFVKRSIKEFGYLVPIVIDKNNEIIAGHTRYKALKQLKIQEVPCILADELTEEQVKAFRIADNSVSDVAEWDISRLAVELSNIKLDMGEFGVDLGTFTSNMPAITPNSPNSADTNNENEPDNEEDFGYYGDERERTYNSYNMYQVDYVDLTKNFWQMPIIHKTNYIPDDLIGFKYAMQTPEDERQLAGLHCFIDDYQFERLWNKPDDYIELVRGFQCFISPDFSLYMDMTQPTKIWNTYRSRLIGAFYQAQGIEVIPCVNWAQADSFDYCFEGLEQGGTIAISTIGCKKDPECLDMWVTGMKETLKRLKPKTILMYGGKIDFDFGKTKVIYYDNHQQDRWKKDKD